MVTWRDEGRPGYFGRRRDEIVDGYNQRYGPGNWRLVWREVTPEGADKGRAIGQDCELSLACRSFYQYSYVEYLRANPDLLDWICSYGECIDNAPTNVKSGRDYTIQESFSTHIQDIAVRNALYILGRVFEGPADKILVIRSKDSEGYRIGPGNVPYWDPSLIRQPSLCPDWANVGSVEDFWQSNKVLQVRDLLGAQP